MLVLLFIVLLGVSCEKSETYDNPYYTKEQLSVIETLCNHEWLNVKEFNYYYGSHFIQSIINLLISSILREIA